jgi:hypothetical protein
VKASSIDHDCRRGYRHIGLNPKTGKGEANGSPRNRNLNSNLNPNLKDELGGLKMFRSCPPGLGFGQVYRPDNGCLCPHWSPPRSLVF